MQNGLFKKKVQKALIIYRSKSLAAKEKSENLVKSLQKLGLSSHAIEEQSIKKPSESSYDLAISLGGDGTYLKAAYYTSEKHIPLLGIHMGSLGFLTPHQENKTSMLLDKIFQGKMFIKKNFFILAKIQKTNQKKQDTSLVFEGVNDVVIERSSLSHLIPLRIHLDENYIYSMKADGLIVASGLGSTAYNLAAGGPIVHPDVQAFTLTPICSHSLTNRPLVISNTNRIYVQLEDKEARLTVDGRTVSTLTPEHRLCVEKSENFFLSLKEEEHAEFRLLRDKLKFGQRD